ncbi:acetate--CoA ligase [Candidatus Methylacidithermus pantelleriae]|uniref:Acetyl-coenzyme A synthetase n=1 Tax=Candidatus Methylacidithermus pantelleriae TaxID=2744239 RepID=A0A8J2BRD1_9BACT|nr:acetate--CoA ligase [Candidatus Methylacidithermus pantelleriae]CAF0704474.1 acetyl-CoA synthetase (AMP-forming) [Candidatus Methylacidithermus pantelleriae]
MRNSDEKSPDEVRGITAGLTKIRNIPSPRWRGTRKPRISSLTQYRRLYRESLQKPEVFWAEQARKISWYRKWRTVSQWEPPFARWFVGGELNACVNCVDRHLEGPRRYKAAIVWEGEPQGQIRVLTYQELHREVCRLANVLLRHGVRRGDRVVIYLPMIPEALITMLACARIGAVHSVVFGGFGPGALQERILDSQARLVVTADGGYRRGAIIPLKENLDAALAELSCVQTVLVVRRTHCPIPWVEGRDYWLDQELEKVRSFHTAERMGSEDPLFILYTSGSTGKPKGVLHTTAGYLLGAMVTTEYIFDLRDEDLYWCTADVGWITGHSYVVYGPLACGGTVFVYEGAPDHPSPSRFWEMIERHRISIFYTAPTAIRAFLRWGEEWLSKSDLSSLRLLGSVGEPINPEVWMWYFEKVGGGRCPVVDTWWQTETGAIMIAPLPGVTPLKPGSATLPFFGVDAAVVDPEGNELPPGNKGRLVLRRPWPSMLRTLYQDPDAYRQIYWTPVPGCYFTGDAAYRDQDGYFWIVGRMDDVLNVSGHRLGTAEVESALVSHPAVAEAAVVGRPDPLKGQALVAFVILKEKASPTQALMEELRAHVARQIGPIAKPEEIHFTEALPKTRSGKIMRRLLKSVANRSEVRGDLSTLEDQTVLQKLAAARSEPIIGEAEPESWED